MAWTTWETIGEVVRRQRDSFTHPDGAAALAVRRLADAVTTAIDWHGGAPGSGTST
jgi:hypothetical protein